MVKVTCPVCRTVNAHSETCRKYKAAERAFDTQPRSYAGEEGFFASLRSTVVGALGGLCLVIGVALLFLLKFGRFLRFFWN